MTVRVTGASDDLIEIDGGIVEEWGAYDDGSEGSLLAFSDGTVLRIRYTETGVWRIELVHKGGCEVRIDQAPEGDDQDYTDAATLTGPLDWVVRGVSIAKAK